VLDAIGSRVLPLTETLSGLTWQSGVFDLLNNTFNIVFNAVKRDATVILVDDSVRCRRVLVTRLPDAPRVEEDTCVVVELLQVQLKLDVRVPDSKELPSMVTGMRDEFRRVSFPDVLVRGFRIRMSVGKEDTVTVECLVVREALRPGELFIGELIEGVLDASAGFAVVPDHRWFGEEHFVIAVQRDGCVFPDKVNALCRVWAVPDVVAEADDFVNWRHIVEDFAERNAVAVNVGYNAYRSVVCLCHSVCFSSGCLLQCVLEFGFLFVSEVEIGEFEDHLRVCIVDDDLLHEDLVTGFKPGNLGYFVWQVQVNAGLVLCVFDACFANP